MSNCDALETCLNLEANPLKHPSDAQATLARTPNAQKYVTPVWPTCDTGYRLVFRAEGGGAGAARDKPGYLYRGTGCW